MIQNVTAVKSAKGKFPLNLIGDKNNLSKGQRIPFDNEYELQFAPKYKSVLDKIYGNAELSDYCLPIKYLNQKTISMTHGYYLIQAISQALLNCLSVQTVNKTWHNEHKHGYSFINDDTLVTDFYDRVNNLHIIGVVDIAKDSILFSAFDKDVVGEIENIPYTVVASKKSQPNELNGHSPAALVYTYLIYILKTTSFNNYFHKIFKDLLNMLFNNSTYTETYTLLSILENNLYFLMFDQYCEDAFFNEFGQAKYKSFRKINATIFNNKDIKFPKVDDKTIDSIINIIKKQSDSNKSFNYPLDFLINSTGVTNTKNTVKDYNFTLDPTRELTLEELSMIPNYDNYVPNPQVVMDAKLLYGFQHKFTGREKPLKNLLWSGEAGTGKTTAAKMLAQMLHLPYTYVSISPSTEIEELTLNCMPNSGNTEGKSTKLKCDVDSLIKEIPSVMDMYLNPTNTYQKLTGITKFDVTENDIKKALIEQISNKQLVEADVNGTSQFMYVESEFVKAFKNGWVCEVQEANTAARPGVLAGLNSALDNCQSLTLPNGELIKRHADTVIVFTLNEDYEGTRPLNQSVLSRFPIKHVFELPKESELINQIKANSGLDDADTIKKMIKVMARIKEVLEDEGEINGICSVREITNWASITKLMSDPYDAAIMTIINSASRNAEVQEKLITALETEFTKN